VTDHPQELNLAEERFRAYLDEELSSTEREAFEAELEGDADMKREFELYRSTVELLHRVGPIQAPDSLLPNIQKRLAGRHMREDYGPTIRFPYEVLIFVVLLGCVFYLYATQLPGGPGTISNKERPQIVEVDLTRPAGNALEQEFGLQLLETGRPFERTVYGTFSQEDAQQLMVALEPVLATPQSLPRSKVRAFSMVLTSPLK
jgi:hypothetical protein